jgi:hypothetical protein
VQFTFRYFVNGDEQTGLETIFSDIVGGVLGTMILDQDVLGGEERVEKAVPFCATGNWIKLQVTEEFGTSKVQIPSQDLKFQVKP